MSGLADKGQNGYTTSSRAARRAHQRLAAASARVMATPEGRLVVRQVLAYCGLMSPIPADPVLAQRLAGRRDVGLELLGLLGHTAYATLMLEQATEAERSAMGADERDDDETDA